MYNYSKTGLAIFDNFQIDFNLPKWQERIKKVKETGESFNLPIYARNRNSRVSVGGAILLSPTAISGFTNFSGSSTTDSKIHKESVFKKAFENIFQRSKLRKIREQHESNAKVSNFSMLPPEEITEPLEEINENEVSVEDFFKSVKNSAEELKLVTEHSTNYEKIISHLKATGQEALYEHMSIDIEAYRSEAQLYATGHRKVITEDNIVAFIKDAPKKIRLDWVKNFTRSIPSTVVDLKIKLDELHIFDNYVVMHYDPDNKGNAMTLEEKKKSEDPILFGVIAGSQKLYYVGDWIDEYCDLTFDKLVEKLGAEAISANDIKSNVSIPIEPMIK